jgi:hypothetical protein
MYETGVLVMLDIPDNRGYNLNSHVENILYPMFIGALPRPSLQELMSSTYKSLIKQMVMNTSDNYADFCFNLLSLPNYNTLPYSQGSNHPLAYLQDRQLSGLTSAVKELGLSLFFAIESNRPANLQLSDVAYVDNMSIGLLYNNPKIESLF